jgi:hypothetical protein
MQRLLIVAGIAAILPGLPWPWPATPGPGRLPRDSHARHEGFSFHFPLMTSFIVSIVVTPSLRRRRH